MPTQNVFPNARQLPAYPSYPKTKIPYIHQSQVPSCVFPIFNNTLKTFIHFFGHRNDSGSTWCFRILNNILHSSGSLKLMIYTYLFFFKINIGKCQSAELWNTKSGFKEDKHTIIVSLIMLIVLNKFQELSCRICEDATYKITFPRKMPDRFLIT